MSIRRLVFYRISCLARHQCYLIAANSAHQGLEIYPAAYRKSSFSIPLHGNTTKAVRRHDRELVSGFPTKPAAQATARWYSCITLVVTERKKTDISLTGQAKRRKAYQGEKSQEKRNH